MFTIFPKSKTNVIARCQSITVNPYWRDLVNHARDTRAVLKVPIFGGGRGMSFGELHEWEREAPINGEISQVTTSASVEPDANTPSDPRKVPSKSRAIENEKVELNSIEDPKARKNAPLPKDPRKKAAPTSRPLDPRSNSGSTTATPRLDPRKPKLQSNISTRPERTDPRKK